MGELLTLVLAGDVMTGRGVDQVLPHPGVPDLEEHYVTDARTYVRLAERVAGAIPQPVAPEWPWGDALGVMDAIPGSVRVMNLETSVTVSEDRAPGKAVHYRMSPANLEVLRVARVDVWALANNHVLDHGARGLGETLDVLGAAGLVTTGAGPDAAAAWRPVRVCRPGSDRGVVVGSVAHASSGVPPGWAAAAGRPGVALLPDLDGTTADALAERLAQASRAGDVRVVSIHWGGNWGFEVPSEHRDFARRLVDGGVHVVHGHSSHHPRPVEVYRGCPVLYGCGDLVNDYEGISGYDEFRDDLRLLYLVRLDADAGRLESLRMVPFRARRLRLEHAPAADAQWLVDRLSEAGHSMGTHVEAEPGGILRLCHD